MDWIRILGFVAGIITAAGLLPQLIKTWRTKEVEEISLGMYAIYIIGFILWITYGFLREDYPIVCTNAASLLMSGLMVFLQVRYRE